MKQFDKLDIIFCGVGGQGIVSMAQIAQKLICQDHYDVKCFDVMGLGQRGGSVSSHLRLSKYKIMSPLVPAGKADYLIGLEQTETLRNLHYLSPTGQVIVCDYKLTSPSISTGLEQDSTVNIEDIFMARKCKNWITHKNNLEAQHIGHVNINFYLLSILLCLLEYDLPEAINKLKMTLHPGKIQDNLFAFEKGADFFKRVCTN